MSLSIEVYNPSRKLEFFVPKSTANSLEPLFNVSQEILVETLSKVRNSQLLPQLFRGRFSHDSDSLDLWKKNIEHSHPINPKSPFEKVNEISGAYWSGQNLFKREINDALVKLCFDYNANLSAHTHHWSDRVIFFVGGSGYFYASWQPFQIFSGEDMISFPVTSGDILVFSRGFHICSGRLY